MGSPREMGGGRGGVLWLPCLLVLVAPCAGGVDKATREVLSKACKRYIDVDPALPCDDSFSDKPNEIKVCKRMLAALEKFGYADINTADPNADKWKTQCEAAYKNMKEPKEPEPAPVTKPSTPPTPPAVKIDAVRQDTTKCFPPSSRSAVYTCEEEYEKVEKICQQKRAEAEAKRLEEEAKAKAEAEAKAKAEAEAKAKAEAEAKAAAAAAANPAQAANATGAESSTPSKAPAAPSSSSSAAASSAPVSSESTAGSDTDGNAAATTTLLELSSAASNGNSKGSGSGSSSNTGSGASKGKGSGNGKGKGSGDGSGVTSKGSGSKASETTQAVSSKGASSGKPLAELSIEVLVDNKCRDNAKFTASLRKDLADALSSDLPPTNPEEQIKVGTIVDGTWTPKPQRAIEGAPAAAGSAVAPTATADGAQKAMDSGKQSTGSSSTEGESTPNAEAQPEDLQKAPASEQGTSTAATGSSTTFLEINAGFDPVIKGVAKIKVSLAPGYTDLMETLAGKLKPSSPDDPPYQFQHVSELCDYRTADGKLVAVELWNGKGLQAPVQACYEAPEAPDAPLKGHPTNSWLTAKAADACSGHGACVVLPLSQNPFADRNPYVSACKCEDGFVGKACQAECPASNGTQVCSGHGVCSVKGAKSVRSSQTSSATEATTGVAAQASGAGSNGAEVSASGAGSNGAEVSASGQGSGATSGSSKGQAATKGSDASLLQVSSAGDADASDIEYTETAAVCTCNKGWMGASCAFKKCPLGPNGKMCSGEERGECTTPNGICKCRKGWTGPNCDTECPMTSGEECGGPDRGQCSLNGATPTAGGFKVGTCICRTEDGIRGNRCQIDCPRAHGKICNGKGVCGDDGSCKCKEAYIVGHACHLECARHGPIICGHGSCDSKTGECKCKAGFMGNACGQKETDLRAIYCKGGTMIADSTIPDELKKYGDFCGKQVRAPSLAKGDECTSARGCPPTLDGKTRYCVNVAKKGSNENVFACRECLPSAPMADCSCPAEHYCVKDILRASKAHAKDLTVTRTLL